MNEILNEYKGFINLLANKYGQNKFDDDLKQEGYIGLILAHQRYKDEVGPFENYAKRYIKGSMLTFLNMKTSVVKKQTNKKEFPLVVGIENPIDDNLNTLADVMEDEFYDESMDDNKFNKIHKLKYHIKKMDVTVQKILEMRYNQEKTFNEMSEDLIHSGDTCRAKHRKAIEHLQSKMGTPQIDYLKLVKIKKVQKPSPIKKGS
ncbi:MAG TPA: sigma-70 family RNA polymerase sigma factor [Flavobacterium sp.]|uniref:sigma-70 family RNA polymerase sigma factor n=1 Tax=unclassified Flavobacterium TaxID=196869 RepID=UPI0025C18C7E|nr:MULTISPECIES: sigma-70 family RNA polymerase sigma factor [unclassified Flavobacterium]HRE77121.1 sigma-70 family RNA polymerase sigma factor [Flavobacterium sp.]